LFKISPFEILSQTLLAAFYRFYALIFAFCIGWTCLGNIARVRQGSDRNQD
jgi:hypothetical protein